MTSNKTTKKNKVRISAGFTLIELLVAIAIISILSSVVLASISNIRVKAKNAAVISQNNEFIKAIQLFFEDHGVYPDAYNQNIGGAPQPVGTRVDIYPNTYWMQCLYQTTATDNCIYASVTISNSIATLPEVDKYFKMAAALTPYIGNVKNPGKIHTIGTKNYRGAMHTCFNSSTSGLGCNAPLILFVVEGDASNCGKNSTNIITNGVSSLCAIDPATGTKPTTSVTNIY